MQALSLIATRTFLGQWSRRKALAARTERRLARSEFATLQAYVAEVRALLRSGGSLDLSDELRGYASRFEAKASSFLHDALSQRSADRVGWQSLQLLAHGFNQDYEAARAELIGQPWPG